jgi:hypothetical protein
MVTGKHFVISTAQRYVQGEKNSHISRYHKCVLRWCVALNAGYEVHDERGISLRTNCDAQIAKIRPQ